jgi:hypothetical protein
MPDYRASWYSQLPAFGWFDREDRPGSNALGVPDWQQGIALPSRRTLGQYFNVTSPGGQTLRLRQTDVGPAPWTGRGVDVSAAAANQFGYTPKTFPTDASFTVEPAEGGSMPDMPQGRRNMPSNSLMDLLSGNTQPMDTLGQPTGWGNALASRSNSLIGLGLGLLQPYNPWAGTNPYSNALRGYMAGAQGDEEAARSSRDFAFRQQQARLAQANFNRQQGRLEQSPADQMIADLRKYAGTPYENEVKTYYAKQTGGQWQLADVGVDQWNRPIKKWVNNVTQEIRDINNPPPGAATAFAGSGDGGGAVPYLGGGPFRTGTQGPQPGAVAAPGGAGGTLNAPPMVTLPDGSTVPLPPGMDAKTAATHAPTSAVDALTGKYTGEQAKTQLFANRMEISQRTLNALDKTGNPIDVQGTSILGGGIERMPGSDKLMFGNLLQKPEYQAYRQAKDSFINALLRNESGAAINTGEYVRIDREMFPQPGDSAQTIAAKRDLRNAALQGMIRAAGPGYRSPQTETSRASGSGAPAQDGGAKVPTYNLQTGKFE